MFALERENQQQNFYILFFILKLTAHTKLLDGAAYRLSTPTPFCPFPASVVMNLYVAFSLSVCLRPGLAVAGGKCWDRERLLSLHAKTRGAAV